MRLHSLRLLSLDPPMPSGSGLRPSRSARPGRIYGSWASAFGRLGKPRG